MAVAFGSVKKPLTQLVVTQKEKEKIPSSRKCAGIDNSPP
jgi:hypothetical protein